MSTLRSRATTSSRSIFIALAACTAASAHAAYAADVSWVSSAGGDWNIASNWSSNPLLPGASDDVTIAALSPITVALYGGSPSIQSLTSNNILTLAGGSLSVANTLQINSNGTLNVNQNSTLQNATLLAVGNGSLHSNGGTFSNVTLASSYFYAANNLTLAGNYTLNSGTYYANLYFTTSANLTGNGTVFFNGTYGSGGSISYSGGLAALTITPGVTVATGTGSGSLSFNSLLNQGTISAQTASKSLSITGQNFTNAGSLQAINGGTLNISASNWTSTGSISLDATSTINLYGNFATASLGNISRTGGNLTLLGTLDNTGSTLALTPTTGSLIVTGTIKNGAISTAGGARFIPNGGTFSNVSLGSDITLTADSLYITNNLSLGAHTLTLDSTGYYANLFLSGTETLSGSGTIVFNGSYGSGSYIGISSGTATIAPGLTLKTGNGNGAINSSGLLNQGTISAETAGKSFSIGASSFTNAGTLRAVNGSTLIISANNWSSNGSISADPGSTLILGGSFATASLDNLSTAGANVTITGNLNNAGATLALTPTTGSIHLTGTINNGNISSSGGAQLLVSNGTFNNVTLASDFTESTSGIHTQNNLTLANCTLTLDSSTYYANLGLLNSQTYTGNGTILFNGSYGSGGYIGGSGGAALTVDTGITLSTGTGNANITTSALINKGTLSAKTAGKTFLISSPTFTNNGIVQATNGSTFIINPVPTNFSNGTLTGGTWIASNGTIRFPGNITTNNANIVLDGSAANITYPGGVSALALLSSNTGNLTITGGAFFAPAASLTNTGTLVVGPGSTLSVGQLTLNGGLLAGAGTVYKTIHAGAGPHTIHPGMPGSAAPGTLTAPSLTTNANTTLAFNLVSPESPSAISSNDQLHITDPAGLTLGGGNIQITSLPAGAASLGYYRIIQFNASFSGALSSLVLPAPVDGIRYTLDATRDAGFIDLHRGFLGDANDDGKVDLSDLSIVLNNFGTTTSLWTRGNFDGAATIDLTDLSDVLNYFGTSLPAAAISTGSPSAAPEPASLAFFLAPALLLRRRRRSR
ncbi:MAG: hypothetical protein ACTHN5_04960 [Phycisphaerae bacterium]